METDIKNDESATLPTSPPTATSSAKQGSAFRAFWGKLTFRFSKTPTWFDRLPDKTDKMRTVILNIAVLIVAIFVIVSICVSCFQAYRVEKLNEFIICKPDIPNEFNVQGDNPGLIAEMMRQDYDSMAQSSSVISSQNGSSPPPPPDPVTSAKVADTDVDITAVVDYLQDQIDKTQDIYTDITFDGKNGSVNCSLYDPNHQNELLSFSEPYSLTPGQEDLQISSALRRATLDIVEITDPYQAAAYEIKTGMDAECVRTLKAAITDGAETLKTAGSQDLPADKARLASDYVLWANVLSSHERYVLADQRFSEALKIDPDCWPAVYDQGVSYDSRNDVESALQCYARAVALINGCLNTGSAIYGRGNDLHWKSSVEELLGADDILEANSGVLNGDETEPNPAILETAINQLNAAVADDQTNSPAYYYLACATLQEPGVLSGEAPNYQISEQRCVDMLSEAIALGNAPPESYSVLIKLYGVMADDAKAAGNVDLQKEYQDDSADISNSSLEIEKSAKASRSTPVN